MSLIDSDLCNILEAALLGAGKVLSLQQLQNLFTEYETPSKQRLNEQLLVLQESYQNRGVEVVEVANGWRIQVSKKYSPWVSRLWDEKPQRYSRALLETLALVAYRQPITRGDIEDIRGVSVSSHITKTLIERDWIRVIGHREVPGRPALFATTKVFLDYFGLKSLNELPTLAEIRDLNEIERELEKTHPELTAVKEEDNALLQEAAQKEPIHLKEAATQEKAPQDPSRQINTTTDESKQ